MFNIFSKRIEGFLYISDKSRDDRFIDVHQDSIIKNKSKKPPYFVVNHNINRIIITEWPGKLFFVETLSSYWRLNRNLLKNAGYTRANGVKILEVLELHKLFGKNGKLIKQVVDKSNNIEIDEAKILSKHLKNKSCEIYDIAWKRWLALKNIQNENSENYLGTSGIISNETELDQYSPLGEVLSIIGNLLYKRIQQIDNENGLIVDNEGEIRLSNLWNTTQQTLFNIAMAYENQNILNEQEKLLLLEPWNILTNE